MESKRSLVKVTFKHYSYEPTYYNDKFDLKVGDKVYVDGKFEGEIGTVIEVIYTFKIKLSDYQKVIAVVDTTIKGEFTQLDCYMTTFDPNALPVEKAKLWFNPPLKENDEIVSARDGKSFALSNMEVIFDDWIVNSGKAYYKTKSVLYFHLENNHVYAIVEGTKNYEVEFDYSNGIVSNLMCNCFCIGNCKHEYATLLMLKDMLKAIDDYSMTLCPPKRITAVRTDILFNYSINKKTGTKINL